MPSKAMHFCNHHGCPELTATRYCDKHTAEHEQNRVVQRAQYQKTRPSAASQGYDADWTRARRMKLSRSPLCEMCQKEGRIVPAVIVHHRKELLDGGARLDPENLVSVCAAHHEQIHGPNRWKKREDRSDTD